MYLKTDSLGHHEICDGNASATGKLLEAEESAFIGLRYNPRLSANEQEGATRAAAASRYNRKHHLHWSRGVLVDAHGNPAKGGSIG